MELKCGNSGRITAHEGPLKPSDPTYKGSKYNVMIEWENGEITSEPLTIIAADDPVTCAIYAKENGLLDLDSWKRFKGIAKQDKKFLCMVNQAKLWSYRTAPCYKYGYEVPGTTIMPSSLTSAMGTPSGKTLLPLRCPSSMSTRPSRT